MKDYINLCENMISFQGEGSRTGKRVLLLRFKECNFQKGNRCYFCDTMEKLDNMINAKIEIADIQSMVDKNKCGILVTGGEPTFSQNLTDTFKLLTQVYCNQYIIETNGFNLLGLITMIYDNKRLFKDKNITLSYSPKILNYHRVKVEYKRFDKIMNYWNRYIIDSELKDRVELTFKFVCEDKFEYWKNAVEYLNSRYNINYNIYFMPEGRTKNEIIKNTPKVLEYCNEYKVNFSSRSHIIHGFV